MQKRPILKDLVLLKEPGTCMLSKKQSSNEGKEREEGIKVPLTGSSCPHFMSDLTHHPVDGTPQQCGRAASELTQQMLEHLLHTDAHIQLQMYGQLLFQEGRLILKYSLITYNRAEN